MPDYWPQASVVKHRMWVHYVHFTYTVPSCLAIYLPISGHGDQKETEIYKGKKDSEASSIKGQHFQTRCRCWYIAKNSTYSIYNRVWHCYRRKMGISLPTTNNVCHTGVLLHYYLVHIPKDFKVITWYFISSLVHLFNIFRLKYLKVFHTSTELEEAILLS